MTTIEDLRRLEREASFGPWVRDDFKVFGRGGRAGQVVICETVYSDREIDFDLIVAARNSLPALIDIAEAARRLNPPGDCARDCEKCANAYEALEAALSKLSKGEP
jgi:hypothetical protein